MFLFKINKSFVCSFLLCLLKGNISASSWRRRTRTKNKALHRLLARPKATIPHSYHVQSL